MALGGGLRLPRTQDGDLIDGYDTPIVRGHLAGWCDEVTSFLRSWLTAALRDTDSLFLAVLTGVVRLPQESIISDLDDVVVDTPLDHRYAETSGFMRDEAQALADHVGVTGREEEMGSWYDGYSFGGRLVCGACIRV